MRAGAPRMAENQRKLRELQAIIIAPTRARLAELEAEVRSAELFAEVNALAVEVRRRGRRG